MAEEKVENVLRGERNIIVTGITFVPNFLRS